ncbi:MAG: hypothetical protein FWE31_03940 [Firmicutes bacterium]|nr:hypothetical protein [Bacillota bacterium]
MTQPSDLDFTTRIQHLYEEKAENEGIEFDDAMAKVGAVLPEGFDIDAARHAHMENTSPERMQTATESIWYEDTNLLANRLGQASVTGVLSGIVGAVAGIVTSASSQYVKLTKLSKIIDDMKQKQKASDNKSREPRP